MTERTKYRKHPKGQRTFRQADVVRAIKATRAAGEKIARVEIHRDGRIIVLFGEPQTSVTPSVDLELEKWIKHHEAEED